MVSPKLRNDHKCPLLETNSSNFPLGTQTLWPVSPPKTLPTYPRVLCTQTLWPVSPPKTLPTYPRVPCDLESSSIVIHEGFTHAISPSWTVLSFIAHTFSPVSWPFQNKVLQLTLNLLLFWVFITTSYKPAPMYLLSPLTLNSPWRQDLSLSSFLLLTFHTVPEPNRFNKIIKMNWIPPQ